MKLRTFSLLFFLFSSFPLFAQNGLNKYLQQPVPVQWQECDSTFQQTLPIDDQWWKAFQDPVLDSLIIVSVKQNYSALIALDRIDMASANFRIQRGNYYPTSSLDAGWNKLQSSGNSSAAPQARQDYFSTAVNMNWEIDVFGSIRNRVKAQREAFEATKEDYNATMVSLCAQVASAYINLREMQQELVVAQKNCISQEAVMKITEVRYNTGLVSKLDVAQAKSVYYSTKASIPVIEAGIIQYMNALSVLLGLYPQELKPVLEPIRGLPNYMEFVGVGVPANLLRRRPDVRAAERQVNAQAALLGASKADWMPRFLLNASVGYASANLKDFTDNRSLTYQIAPSISINLFQGNKLKNAERLAKSELNEYINQFNQTVLTAMQEADNAMSSYRNSIKQIVALREVLNQGQQTLDLSLELYKQGLSPFQNVLDAQRSLLAYENSLVQAKGNSLLYLIQLYQTLGGGWSE